MVKQRFPLQVSPKFKMKLDEIQKKIMMSRGEKISLREITEEMISSPIFDSLEKNLTKSGDLKNDIKIKFDVRGFLE